ncbi:MULTISPECIES: cyclic nucleotide-binding domain-containing protein [unclassified Anabaena]|uniref:cyclic nucleotide-binding domain-containing protein n=1 Tax=unclassified Anabaena TaxID=2619674 RepID=UPI00082ED9E2|nr:MULTISPECIES: cyclic nucleotide-binding domain-containing protein [unclassified Anabaena]
MIDIFLKQLSNSDIQWLKQNGHQQNIPAGSVLIEQARSPAVGRSPSPDCFYLLISGELTASISQNQGGRLGSIFAALEDDQNLEQEIASFSPGEVIGKMPVVELTPATMTVRAAENSTVLAIPYEALQEQIEADFGFAARFYRGIAILLSERFGRLIQQFLRQQKGQIPPLQDVPLIFGELSDSDVDWMLGVGKLEAISSDKVLIRTGEQIENLYIILQGGIAVFMKEEQSNRLVNLFAALESNEETDDSLEREIMRLYRGEILGEAFTLDNPMSTYTLRALEDSILLKIPDRQLLVKLQQDVATAARFYRVLAMLLSGRWQGLISRLGYGRSSYQIGQSLELDAEYEDEIDLDLMDNLTLGGARFEWMLKRLKVS